MLAAVAAIPLTVATALHRPLIAAPASTPPRTMHSADHTVTPPAAATTPTAPALHLLLASVPPTTVTPTPPAVWPTPRTPRAALPAATMPRTLTVVSTAPSGVFRDYR